MMIFPIDDGLAEIEPEMFDAMGYTSPETEYCYHPPIQHGPDSPQMNRKKTCCRLGHPYDEANTYLFRGARYCRRCRKLACDQKAAARLLERA